MKTLILICIIFMSLGLKAQNTMLNEYKKTVAETNYQKGNYMVSAFPVFAATLGKLGSDYGFSLGQTFKYGQFMADKLCLNIGSYQNFQYSKFVSGEIRQVSKTTYSTVSLSLRYFVLNKRFTPFADAGFETFFSHNGGTTLHFRNGLYIVGSAYAGLGLSIPISDFNLNISGRYLYPLFENDDALLYNRNSLATGWQPEFGVSYIFNKSKKDLKKPI